MHIHDRHKSNKKQYIEDKINLKRRGVMKDCLSIQVSHWEDRIKLLVKNLNNINKFVKVFKEKGGIS